MHRHICKASYDWAAAQPVLIAPLLAEMLGVLPDHHALARLLP